MMDRETFHRTVQQKWADYLGIGPEMVEQSGVRLIPAPRYAGSGKVDFFHLASLAVLRVDPDWEERVRDVMAAEGGERPLSPAALSAAWDGVQVAPEEATLIYHLYPDDLRPAPPGAAYQVRRLDEKDAAAMADLWAAVPQAEMEEADIGVDHDVAFGCFREGALAAGASGFRMAGFIDIGVLTHPDFRRRGLGKTAVAALCQWAIDRDELLLYRCRPDNKGSHRLAESLGFRRHFRQESAHLKE
jgi:GNAT superfamily N-acetyltransferase